MNTKNFVTLADENAKKYSFLKKFCKYLKNISYHQYEKEKHLLLAEFKKILSNIKELNVNDVLVDYDVRYRYTTPLEYILMTGVSDIVDYFLAEYMEKIDFEFSFPMYCKNILSILYGNLQHRGCSTDVLLPLIYKIEDVAFLDEESSNSKSLAIVNFLILQKDNYTSSEHFLKILETKRVELLEAREATIISELLLSIMQTQQRVDNEKYPKSEKLTKLSELLSKFTIDIEALKVK